MSAAAKTVIDKVRELSDDEKSEFVGMLRNEADESVIDAWEKADQQSWDREGLEEAKRRMEELDSGRVEAVPWEDLHQEIAEKRGIELNEPDVG